ncbi:hypothetical protein B0G52_103275 [Cohnella sp. SGD-V74]|nr:hypothetical protein B0G52_103275 [Cohnella sp. SGD-V74]
MKRLRSRRCNAKRTVEAAKEPVSKNEASCRNGQGAGGVTQEQLSEANKTAQVLGETYRPSGTCAVFLWVGAYLALRISVATCDILARISANWRRCSKESVIAPARRRKSRTMLERIGQRPRQKEEIAHDVLENRSSPPPEGGNHARCSKKSINAPPEGGNRARCSKKSINASARRRKSRTMLERIEHRPPSSRPEPKARRQPETSLRRCL